MRKQNKSNDANYSWNKRYEAGRSGRFMAFVQPWERGSGARPHTSARTVGCNVGKLSAVYAWFLAVAVMEASADAAISSGRRWREEEECTRWKLG